MRKTILYLLAISAFFFLGPFPPGSWVQPSYVCPGEYRPAGYDSLNHTPYWNGNIIPSAITGGPAYWYQIIGGAHDYMGIDSSGGLWAGGSNEGGQDGTGNQTGITLGTWVNITTDSASNAMLPIQGVCMTGTNFSFFFTNILWSTKATGGVVYEAGNLQGGLRGNGTSGASVQSKFVIVPMPNGDTITKIQGLYSIVALTTKDTLLSWGDGNYSFALGQGNSPVSNAPGYIPLPAKWKCYDFASNGVATWLLLDSAGVKKKVMTFGWQFDPAYQGQGSGGTGHNTPTDVTNNPFVSPMMQAGEYPVSADCNNETFYFITNYGKLWAIGGNANGTIGNGKEYNWATAPTPYSWNQGQNTFNQDTIVNIAPGITDWVRMKGGYSNCWYFMAQRANGWFYMWGRNKGGAIWTGVIDGDYTNGTIGANWPNSWDCPYPVRILWPATAVSIQQTPSPYCITNPGASGCSLYPYNSGLAPPTANAGSNQNIGGAATATLAGSGTATSGHYINSYLWTYISGPTVPIIQFPAVPNTTISNLRSGVYTMQLTVMDNNLKTNSATMTITVGCSGCLGPIIQGQPTKLSE